MKNLKRLLLLAIALAMFTNCNVSKNQTTANHEFDTTKTVENQTQNLVENNNLSNVNYGKDTIIDGIEYVQEPIDMNPPIIQQITTPMPQIFTDLFPDVKWELVIDNEGLLRYYRTSNLEKTYAFDIVNDFVYSHYKPDEITDKELVEFFIFLFFNPYDCNMKILKIEEKQEVDYNIFYSVILLNQEEINCETIVYKNKIYNLKSYRRGLPFKNTLIIF